MAFPERAPPVHLYEEDGEEGPILRELRYWRRAAEEAARVIELYSAGKPWCRRAGSELGNACLCDVCARMATCLYHVQQAEALRRARERD